MNDLFGERGSRKYLNGVPEDSRAKQDKSLHTAFLHEKNVNNIRKLNSIAQQRGQSLTPMVIAWVLRKEHIATALIGTRWPSQVADCAKAIDHLEFMEDELAPAN